MVGHRGMRAEFYNDESRSEKSESSEDARTDRRPKMRLEQFKSFAPHWSVH
jgi:hypothetical protein